MHYTFALFSLLTLGGLEIRRGETHWSQTSLSLHPYRRRATISQLGTAALWAWAGCVRLGLCTCRLRKSHAEEVLESHSGSGGTPCVEAIAHIDVGAGVDHVYANPRPCGAVVLGDGEAADTRDLRRPPAIGSSSFRYDNHGSGSVMRKVHLRKSGI